MATVQVSSVFPAGATVGVYSSWAGEAPSLGQPPRGTAVGSLVVDPDGTVTTDTLSLGVGAYFLHGLVNGVHRYVTFHEEEGAQGVPADHSYVDQQVAALTSLITTINARLALCVPRYVYSGGSYPTPDPFFSNADFQGPADPGSLAADTHTWDDTS